MGVAANYVGALAASAVTAGLTAGMAVAPPDLEVASSVALSDATIPIVDIDQTLGPLSVVRQLTASLQTVPRTHSTTSTAALDALSQTTVQGLFGPIVDGKWTTQPGLSVIDTPGVNRFEVFGVPTSGSLSVAPLGDLGNSGLFGLGYTPTFQLAQLLGGSDGTGGSFAVSPLSFSGSSQVLPPTPSEAPLVGSDWALSAGTVRGVVKELPAGGDFAQIAASPISGAVSRSATVGSNEVSTVTGLNLVGTTSLFSQGATSACDGPCVVHQPTASFHNEVYVNGQKVFGVNLPEQLTTVTERGSFGVTGTLGGTVTVGNRTFGRIVDVDVAIPRSNVLARKSIPAATLIGQGTGKPVSHRANDRPSGHAVGSALHRLVGAVGGASAGD